MALPRNLKKFDALVKIIEILRSPHGCPWDRAQTHESLRGTLLQECYETLEALDEGDRDKLRGELGDLLLQVVLQAQIATDAGKFDIGDVVEGINEKLIHRHPHVFGSTKAKDADEVMANWEELKREERGADVSMLAHLPKELPALSYAQDMQGRVARVGFDWPTIEGVIDKLAEEVGEFQRAESPERKAAEFGDVLFTLANIARRMDIDLESALRETNQRFYRRFAYMEDLCRQRGLKLSELSLDEQNALWEEAKQAMEK